MKLAVVVAALALAGCAASADAEQSDLPASTVAVIDTGVRASEQVEVREQFVCLPECAVDTAQAPPDSHGTQVASVAAYSFGGPLPVVSYRVSDGSWIDVAGIARAITDAGRRGIRTINVSIAAFSGEDAIAAAIDGLPRGIRVIAAAATTAESAPCSHRSSVVVCLRSGIAAGAPGTGDPTDRLQRLRGTSFAAAAYAGKRANGLRE